MVLLAITQVPGSGAAREPDFADGMQAASVAWELAQLPESAHCTASTPAAVSIPDVSGADDAGRCSV